MSKLGQLLKSEREKRGLSLHEIGMTLKINSKVLRAIEDGDQKNYPAKAFLRGFVKSYAQFLRIDTRVVLDLFQEEFGASKPEDGPRNPSATSEGSLSSSEPGPAPTRSTPKKYESRLVKPENPALPGGSTNRIYTIVGGICLLLLIAFVAKMVDKYQKESRIAGLEPTVVSSEPPLATAEVPSPAPTENYVTPASGATVAAQPAASSLPVATTLAPTTTVTILTTTTARATTTSTSTSTTASSTSTTVKVQTQPAAVSAPTAKNTEVIIEALNKVTLRFSLNGGKTESLELVTDQTHTLRSKGNIQMEVSDGGAVSIIVNGRVRGVPGSIGKSIKLSFP